MDFGSSLILSKPIDPSIDYEAIDTTKYSSGIRAAMARNVKERGEDTCLLDIIDTAGQDEYSSLREEYMRKSQAFLIVFSVTSSASLQEAVSIYDFCCRLKQVSSVPAVLCGNMNDLTNTRQVSDAEALSLAKARGMWYFSTSAKTGENVQNAFMKLIRMTPRTGIEYKIAVLGAGGVGKSATTFRFLRNEFIEDYDPTVEDTFRKQIFVSGLPPMQPSTPVLEEDDDFLIVDAPRAPSVSAPRAPSVSSHKTTDMRKVPKKDANVAFVNLGSLAPENFDELDIKTLPAPPPSCSSCSAVLSTSTACAFCGSDHPNLPENLLQPREKIEEYTLVPGQELKLKAPEPNASVPAPPAFVNLDDRGLVVFCIDISGSMNIRAAHNEMQSMWHSIKKTGTTGEPNGPRHPSTPSRLDHMKEAVQVHLERLKENYPNRKVALIAFHEKLECFLNRESRVIHIPAVDSLEEGMGASQVLTNAPWKTVSQSFDALSRHTAALRTKGSTALGSALAVALGLAQFHSNQFSGASTDIFVCTDGASNTGAGRVNVYGRMGAQETAEHGRSFYSLAGETAVSNSAKINIIGIDGEGMALDVLSVAAQVSGGVLTKVSAAELRREIRQSSQRRVLAKNVSVKLYLPKEWTFLPTQRKGVTISENTLSYKQAQVDDEASVSFPFTVTDEGKTKALAGTLQIQAQMTYTTANTGAVKVRHLHQIMPLTADRELSEAGINIALMGTYILQSMGFAMNEILVRTIGKSPAQVQTEAKDLRDALYAYRRLLIRGARSNTQQEELSKFEEDAEKLDSELAKMATPAETWTPNDRDTSSALVTQYQAYDRNSLVGSSNAAWGNKVRRTQQMR